jgi:glutamate racemase
MKEAAVGIFDSGVGGLSVWRELIKILPAEEFLYVSDNAFCPYGRKSAQEIIDRTYLITDFFINRGVKLVVVACNTATAAAIDALRLKYPNLPFVGMEPAVKPAALHSETGVIGVLATNGTFNGKLYNRTLERFATDIKVIEQRGDGLVEIVESGDFDSKNSYVLLKKYIDPMIESGADYIVLGCTHYPFLAKQIGEIAGEKVKLIDPAPAVAIHTRNILAERKILAESVKKSLKRTLFFSTGDITGLKNLALTILPGIPEDNFFKLNF